MLDPVTISLALGKLAGKPAAKITTDLLKDKTWPQRTAHAALGKVPKPRPRRALTAWLSSPDVLRDVLLSGSRPTLAVAQELERALQSDARWRRLDPPTRLQRAQTVLDELYDDVLRKHASWALRISTTRLADQAEHHHSQQLAEHATTRSQVAAVAANVEQIAATHDVAARVRERLPRLPAALHDIALLAVDADTASTWRLIDSLTNDAEHPRDVVGQWTDAVPSYLHDAPSPVLKLAADLAFTYDADEAGIALLLQAADAGTAQRQTLIAHAALMQAGLQHGDALETLRRAGTTDQSPQPFVRAVHALLHEQWSQVRAELDRWTPSDRADTQRRFMIQDAWLMASLPDRRLTPEVLSASIDDCRTTLAAAPGTQLALVLAQRLLQRVGLSASTAQLHDLREAATLAVNAALQRRSWRGDSAEAIALACQAAIMAGELRTLASLGPGRAAQPRGQSAPALPVPAAGPVSAAGLRLNLPALTEDEVQDPRVLVHIVFAQVILRQHDTAPDVGGLTGFDAARITATWHDRAGKPAGELWQRALTAAADDRERLIALQGLASTGADELPGLDEFEHSNPAAVAQIRAASALARGDGAQAQKIIKGYAGDSVFAALLLGQAQEKAGQPDRAVDTLLDAAQRFTDPDLSLTALYVMLRAQQQQQAEALARKLLAVDPLWSGRAEALGVLAQLVAERGELEEATELATQACAADPHDPQRRWLLINLLMHRAEFERAIAALREHPEPLTPQSPEQARLWVALLYDQGTSAEKAAAATHLVDRFADNEELYGAAITLILLRGDAADDAVSERPSARPVNSHNPTESTPAHRDRTVEEYLQRYPNGAVKAIKIPDDADAATILDALTPYARVEPETARARRELHATIARQELPLGALTAANGKSYAELLLFHGFGVLPATHPDPAEHQAAVNHAIAALDSRAVLDTTAVVALAGLPQPLRDRLVHALQRIEILDKTYNDLRHAQRQLVTRSDMTIGWDDVAQRAQVHFTPEAELERQRQLAREALGVAKTARVRTLPPDANVRQADAHFEPWWSTLRAGRRLGIALWADDATLRGVAHQEGTPTFSTAALLDALLHTGGLTREQHQDAQRALIRSRVSVPHALERYIEVAEDERWTAGSATLGLAQPINWTDPIHTHRIFTALVPAVAEHQPQALPEWLYCFARGAAYLHSNDPQLAAELAGVLLAGCLHYGRPLAGTTPQLLQAAHVALREAAHDPLLVGDPLPTAVRLLASGYAGALGHAQASAYVSGLFSALDEHARGTVTRTLLAPDGVAAPLHLPTPG